MVPRLTLGLSHGESDWWREEQPLINCGMMCCKGKSILVGPGHCILVVNKLKLAKLVYPAAKSKGRESTQQDTKPVTPRCSLRSQPTQCKLSAVARYARHGLAGSICPAHMSRTSAPFWGSRPSVHRDTPDSPQCPLRMYTDKDLKLRPIRLSCMCTYPNIPIVDLSKSIRLVHFLPEALWMAITYQRKPFSTLSGFF